MARPYENQDVPYTLADDNDVLTGWDSDGDSDYRNFFESNGNKINPNADVNSRTFSALKPLITPPQ